MVQQKGAVKNRIQRSEKDSAVVLVSSNNHPVFAPTAETSFRITDLTINTLNERAAGAPVPKNSSGIIGVPKYSNGLANGHVLLRSTTPTASGTAFGSGAVGTGTSIVGPGTSKTSLGVNGKSAYADLSLWGSKQPVYTVGDKDSINHQ